MCNEVGNSTRDLLLKLIRNSMTLSRAFGAVARLRYDQGNDEAGEFARRRALKYYSEARRLLIQIAEEDQQSDSDELEKLQHSIVSLQTLSCSAQKKVSYAEEGPINSRMHKIFKRLGLRSSD
jgi:hypothetical protein